MNNQKTSRVSQIGLLLLGLMSVFLGLYVAGQVFSKTKVYAQNANGTQAPGQATTDIPAPENNVAPGPGAPSSGEIDGENSNLPPPESVVAPLDNKGAPLPSGEAAGPTSELSPVEVAGEYRYEPVGKRDPFRPFRESRIGIGQLKSTARNPEPLEKFDVRSLEVIAIVWGNEKPKALIQDPEHHVHTALKGQRIGKNEGFVAEIREGEIVVVELFDLNGKTVKESVVLPIKR